MFIRFISPMQQLAEDMREVPIDRLETIDAYAAKPWNDRVEVIAEECERATELAGYPYRHEQLAKNGRSGLEWPHALQLLPLQKVKFTLQSVTPGTREKQNLYTAELSAVTRGLRKAPHHTQQRVIVVFTSNRGAALSLIWPWHQSEQTEIANFYDCVRQLRKRRNKVIIVWRSQDQRVNDSDENIDNNNN